ncbi:CD048 protein, partial [Upupa epops]|nr:CD048 protein [Upupa epops]
PFPGRPCVDCHAFEFMQRALQDLKKTAYNLDTRTETLLLRVEKRGLCDCFHAM